MGYYEYFVYSKNKNLSIEKLVSKLEKISERLYILCGAQTKTDIYSDKVKLFGYERDITPIKIKSNTKGIMIGTEMKISTKSFSLIDRLKFNPRIVCSDYITLSCNKHNIGKCYKDYFIDKSINVNGNRYFSKLINK